MKAVSDALAAVWRRKLLWLEETLLLAVLIAAVYGWLLLPVATVYHLAVHVLAAAAILALLLFAAWLAQRAFGPVRWSGPALLLPLLAALLVAAGAPYLLINWIPELDTMAAQAVSAGLRFLLAAFLCTFALLSAWACAAKKE